MGATLRHEPGVEMPVFVVGTPRSGTTLMAHILGRHSALFMPGETHFMDDVYARRAQLGNPATPQGVCAANRRLRTLYGRFNEPADQMRVDDLFRRRGLELARPVPGWGALLTRFMALQMQEAGKRRWGNQAPRDIFNVEAILALWPDARFVVCIRDPRDFLASYRGKVQVAVSEAQARRAARLYHPIVTGSLWSATAGRVAWMARRLMPAQWTLVRYEDLVSEPDTTVRAVCGSVGLPFEPDMLQVEGNNSSATTEQPLPHSGIFIGSVGRWRRDLPVCDAQVAQWLVGRSMRKFGYLPARLRTPPLQPLAAAVRTPLALYRGLEANRHLRGPLLPYLAKRMLPRG